jgi:hypothetical protein
MKGKAYRLIFRRDGRVEISAPDGAGHPSKALTEACGTRWQEWMAVHGCGGGCASEGWREAEKRFLTAREAREAREA